MHVRAIECCDGKVHVRVQLYDRPGLAFPLTGEQYLELEGQYFDLMLGVAEGEIRLPVPGGCFLPVDVAEIEHLELLYACPPDTDCLGAVAVPSLHAATIG